MNFPENPRKKVGKYFVRNSWLSMYSDNMLQLFTGIYGDKITANRGEINFLHQNLPKGIAYYRWLIQTFSTAKLKLYFTDFLLNGPAQGAFVQLDRGLSYVHHFSDTSKPQGILEIAGPYIVIAVYGNGTQLAKHGFRLLYGYGVTGKNTLSILLRNKISQR